VVTVLEVAGVEAFAQVWPGLPGRPPCDRAALARAFVAKAVIGLPTTAMLIERLAVDKPMRRLCGWEHPGEVPSEATFSRAFAEFAQSALPARLHAALIERTYEDRLVGHISRDATAIEAREKPVKTAAPAASDQRSAGEAQTRPAEKGRGWSRRRSLAGSSAKLT
jgi:transposase